MRFARRPLVAVLLAGLLVAGACTEDDDEGVATDTTAEDTETTETTEGEEPETTETTEGEEPETTETTDGDDEPAGGGGSAVPEEGEAADDSLDPVRIGFINNDDGPVSFPATSAGFVAGVDYVNAELGGIDGRPMEAVTCSAGLDQESVQACAQQFANDDTIDIIASGFVIVSAPLYPVLAEAGKPILVGVPLSEPDWTNPDTALSFFPGNPGISAGAPVWTVDYAEAESVAIVVSDNDAGQSALELAELVLGEEVTIDPVFVGDDEVDYTGPIQAAGAEDADAFVPLVAQNGCIQVANALETLAIDVPVATTALCAANEVIAAVGPLIQGWTFGFNGPPTLLAAGEDEEVDHYNATYPEYGQVEDKDGAGATTGFGIAITLNTIGDEIGADELSTETWYDGLSSFEGPVYLGPRTIECGANDVFPGLCTTESRWFTLTPEGLVDATDGEVVDPFNR